MSSSSPTLKVLHPQPQHSPSRRSSNATPLGDKQLYTQIYQVYTTNDIPGIYNIYNIYMMDITGIYMVYTLYIEVVGYTGYIH